MVYALDTNCLLRWLIRDLPEQAAVIDRVLERHRAKVADLAIVELVWVMTSYYELSQEVIAESVEKIITHESISANQRFFTKVLEKYRRLKGVSFVDLCLAYHAENSDVQLLTFDKTLAKKLPDLAELATGKDGL